MSIFSKIQNARVPKSTFNLSHQRKFSMGFGYLTPILCLDCFPGDHIRLNTSQMVRVSPMIAPVMHQVSFYTHFFFVPNRLVWSNWESFITGGEDGEDTSVAPYIQIDETQQMVESSLGDYMGIPSHANQSPTLISAIPFAAYQKIWNEYFRDQNLQTAAIDPLLEPDTDLVNASNDFNINGLTRLQIRAYQHDYFTSALPWTQKGPEATIPLGASADIVRLGAFNQDLLSAGAGTGTSGAPSTIRRTDGSSFGPDDVTFNGPAAINNIEATGTSAQINVTGHTTVNLPNFEVDLSTATAASINDLRQAFKLQEWLEKNARGGSRYIESIKSHFNVSSSDKRLQRPEFLGGSRTPIVISEVLQTSDAAAEDTPQGNMAGHGISVGGSNGFNYFCEEHGYIIGVASVLPKTSYQQGIPRHFRKFDKFDYPWPEFGNLGEQPIYNYELYHSDDGLNDDVFGYTPRYAEYKYINDSVHGAFRSSLDFWHLGRIFSSRPTLSSAFIEADPTDVDRIFAVTGIGSKETLYVYMNHRIHAKRALPYFGSPGGI